MKKWNVDRAVFKVLRMSKCISEVNSSLRTFIKMKWNDKNESESEEEYKKSSKRWRNPRK
jgi:uncharacterized protein YlbG (UPF0298 family)